MVSVAVDEDLGPVPRGAVPKLLLYKKLELPETPLLEEELIPVPSGIDRELGLGPMGGLRLVEDGIPVPSCTLRPLLVLPLPADGVVKLLLELRDVAPVPIGAVPRPVLEGETIRLVLVNWPVGVKVGYGAVPPVAPPVIQKSDQYR